MNVPSDETATVPPCADVTSEAETLKVSASASVSFASTPDDAGVTVSNVSCVALYCSGTAIGGVLEPAVTVIETTAVSVNAPSEIV